MNEQIKKLIKQAHIYPYMELNDFRRYETTDFYLNQFAELIVRECMDVVRDINQEYDGGSTVVNAADEIAEHFGVK